MINITTCNLLSQFFASKADIAFAVLIGSQAEGNANANSDYDIAFRWKPGHGKSFAALEDLRIEISQWMKIPPNKFDLIDLSRANLAMKANVANKGLILAGENDLSWAHFLIRTWKEIETFEWEQRRYA